MKKVSLVVILLIVAAVAMTSCKKCVTCTAYEKTTDVIVDQEHLCSNNIEVNNWIDDFKTDWDYGLTYAECEKD
jgi:capsular polysaccharide biosynthesis protein